MKLAKLQLISFRNYDKYELDLNKKTVVIIGQNGVGKTNILEAVYFLSTGKTFRNLDQSSLIKFGEEFFAIKGELNLSEEDKSTLEVIYSNYPRKQKIFKINGVKTPHSKYLGNLVTVLFHPKDLNLIYMEPSLRRKYINLLLSQTDREYLESLTNYTKILKQRNALLNEVAEKNRSEKELDIWDEKLSKEGAKIVFKRIKAINILSNNLSKIYKDISRGNEDVRAKYISTIPIESEDISTSEKTDDEINTIKNAFLKKLVFRRTKDIKFKRTSLGPHRDDIQFTMNSHLIEEFASRGEGRTALIALKFSEIEYIKEKLNISPLLLLDDVFSELDEDRQEFLLKAISDNPSIITSISLPKNFENDDIIQILKL